MSSNSADLGSVEKGASFIEITKHTCLNEFRLKLVLEKMAEVGLVLKREKRYFAKLFFSSAFSVTSSRIPELKKDLRALLSQYVEASETAEGDKVVSLLCALC